MNVRFAFQRRHRLLYWRQKESRLFMNMVGKKANGVQEEPEIAIRLEGSTGFGTRVTLSYWFDRVTLKGWLCCCAPSGLRSGALP